MQRGETAGHGFGAIRSALWFLILSWSMGSAWGCAPSARRVEPRAATLETAALPASAGEAAPLSPALLTLDAIVPSPAVPAAGPEIAPLSERGAAQVAAAKALMADQRYTEASLELERALRYDPHHPEIHRTLAMLHGQAGNMERARSHIAKVLELCSDDGAAYYLRGRSLQHERDNAGALTAYRTALLCPPERRSAEMTMLARYHLAETLHAEGYETAALEQFAIWEHEAADATNVTGSAELTALIRSAPLTIGKIRADILEKLGRPGEAADALREAVQAAPVDVELALRRGKLLLQAGRTEDALAAVRAISSDAPEVLKLLADIHRARGATGELAADLQSRLAERPGDAHLALALVEQWTADGRVSAAIDFLRTQLERHPEAVELRLRLVEALWRDQRWNDALAAAGEGLTRHPDRFPEFEDRLAGLGENSTALEALLHSAPTGGTPQSDYLRGKLARDAGRWELAERFLTASISADPGFAPAREMLARMYLKTLDYEEALAVANRRDPEVAEDPRLEMVLGEIHERLDDADLAEFHYGAAIQLDRRSTQAMLRLADIYARSERALQAQRQLRALLDIESQHESAREMLAFLLLKQGKVEAALQQFIELKKRAVTPAVRARSEVLATQYPRVDPAAYRDALMKAMRQSAPDAASWVMIAESFDENAQTQQRYDAFTEALRVDPENEEAGWGLVGVARRLLRFEEAVRRLEILLPRRPNRHAWRIALIDLHLVLQDYDRALALAEAEEKRSDLDTRSQSDYRLRIVESLDLAGRKDESINRLKEWAESSRERGWRQQLAKAYLDNARPEEAVAIFESLYQADGGNKATLTDLVKALGEAKRFDRAIQYALDWLSEDPDNDDAVTLAAGALSAAQRADDTLELIRAHLRQTLDREYFQHLLIRQLRMVDRHREAAQWVEALLDEATVQMHLLGGQPPREKNDVVTDEERIRRPNEPFGMEKLGERFVELRLELAGTRIDAREYAEAERLLHEWLVNASDPRQRLQYLSYLSACYQAQGMDLKSTEMLEQALALMPGNVGFSNDLAYGWIDRGIRIAEAERLIRYSLASLPREGAYLDTYGWLLYKKGEFTEARKWLEMANRDRADADPVVLDHLGDTLWRLEEKEEAIARWEKSAVKAGELKEEAILAADLRRVREGTARKAEDARAGRDPQVSPLAKDAPAPASDGQ